jgi:hypothetical protein
LNVGVDADGSEHGSRQVGVTPALVCAAEEPCERIDDDADAH